MNLYVRVLNSQRLTGSRKMVLNVGINDFWYINYFITGNFQGHKYILGAPRGGPHREGQVIHSFQGHKYILGAPRGGPHREGQVNNSFQGHKYILGAPRGGPHREGQVIHSFQGHKYILGAPRGGPHREGQVIQGAYPLSQYWTFLYCSPFSHRSSNFAIAKLSLLLALKSDSEE